MNVLIAIDSFKECMSSKEAGDSAAAGVLHIYPKAKVKVLPIADGGEGTVHCLSSALNGKCITRVVQGPLGEKVESQYTIIPDKQMAVIEVASAAGLSLIPMSKRNPMVTSTFGVGQLIADAIDHDCRNFVIGLGGSGTNDAGAGMLSALGYEFLNANGEPVTPGPAGLLDVKAIRLDHVNPKLKECHFQIACDVKNPLCGVSGCSEVFGPQKGATPAMVKQMDEALEHFAKQVNQLIPEADQWSEGAGAAGGLGFAFEVFLGGEIVSGASLILQLIKFNEYTKNADIIITGEGRIDAQTTMGKAPIAVAHQAKEYGKTVIGFAGSLGQGYEQCLTEGIDAMFCINSEIVSQDEVMMKNRAQENMTKTVEQVFRVIQKVQG